MKKSRITHFIAVYIIGQYEVLSVQENNHLHNSCRGIYFPDAFFTNKVSV